MTHNYSIAAILRIYFHFQPPLNAFIFCSLHRSVAYYFLLPQLGFRGKGKRTFASLLSKRLSEASQSDYVPIQASVALNMVIYSLTDYIILVIHLPLFRNFSTPKRIWRHNTRALYFFTIGQFQGSGFSVSAQFGNGGNRKVGVLAFIGLLLAAVA